MLRVLVLIPLLAIFLGACTSDQTTSEVMEVREPVEGKVAKQVKQEEPAEKVTEDTGEPTRKSRGCPGQEEKEDEEIQVGDFTPPEESSVPAYEIVEEDPVERSDVKATRLLVDTLARERSDYTLIAREIKADYEDYDAITVEFTDTTDTLSYNGSALIFNTPSGACYMGYVYGPPNNEGYFVSPANR